MPIQHNTYIQKENHDLFFFQAEDGIRDVAVTGVQTCALPIYYPVRPPAPPEQVAHGQQVFKSNCSFCHGSDGRGGETGPNLVRAQLVLADQRGELITPIVQNGIQAQGMPKFSLTATDIAAIAAWLHSQPLSDRGAPSKLDILVGNAKEGEAYFNGAGHCTQCHSATGDLAGIGARYEPKTIKT